MHDAKGIALLIILLVLAIAASNLWAEDSPWYEHPKEHQTIIADTVSQQLQDTVVDSGDTMWFNVDVVALFPVVTTGPSQAIVDSLNGFISEFVMKHFELQPGATLKERVAAELDSIHGDWKASPGLAWGTAKWETVVEYCDHGIFSLKVIDNVCISCNGSPYREYSYHFALPNLTELSEESFFVAGYRSYLDSVGESTFRKEYNIPIGVPFERSGFHFGVDDNRFWLSSNFSFTDAGITYLYNAYEIASGASGPSWLWLTFDQLRPIINPNGPLAWVLKQ